MSFYVVSWRCEVVRGGFVRVEVKVVGGDGVGRWWGELG